MVSWRNWSANRRRPSWPIVRAKCRVGGQPQDGRRKPGEVARLEQDAGFWQDDLPGPVDVVADDRAADQERLRQDPGETLAQARVNHGIDAAEQLGNTVRAAPGR